MKIITHYYDDVKHDTINCVPLFPVLNLWCEFEAHLTTKSFRSRDQSVRSRCSSHSAAQSHVAYSVQCSHLHVYFLKLNLDSPFNWLYLLPHIHVLTGVISRTDRHTLVAVIVGFVM